MPGLRHVDDNLAGILSRAADQFLQANRNLNDRYGAFAFAHEKLPGAWQTRHALESKLRRALFSPGDRARAVSTALDCIHRWGFNNQELPKSCDTPRWLEDYLYAAHCWLNADTTRADVLVASLKNVFVNGVSIARISKFIAFLCQRRFAIYDSRVSYALATVCTPQGKRLFPLVPGRNGNARSDQLDSQQLSRMYLIYVSFLQIVAGRLNCTAAYVEMALFMLGQNRNSVTMGFDHDLLERLTIGDRLSMQA